MEPVPTTLEPTQVQEPDADERNHAVWRSLVLDTGQEMLLPKKASGQEEHGGGPRIFEQDPEYALMLEFVDRTLNPGRCE